MVERMLRLAGLLLVLLCSAPVLALEAGHELPALAIEELGELDIADDKIVFAPWNSSTLVGRVQVVQYMAARLSAKPMNEPLTDRLKDSGIAVDRYHVTTIVNLDDALFGTRGFVLSELEKNKRRYYLSSIVADAEGLGRQVWGLKKKSSAIIVLDAGGRIRFFRDGALSEPEIEQVMELVRAAPQV